MTAEIINLRRARKAKQRREGEERAAQNRARFGRPKAEREATEAAKTRATQQHDGLQREREPSKPGDMTDK
jgi:hypothetical protein